MGRYDKNMAKPELKFVEKCCATCRYWRYWLGDNCPQGGTECLLLGRSLSAAVSESDWSHKARYCNGWKKRPKEWCFRVDKNPYWNDPYISRITLLNLRRRLKIK
jgi:hypothetical protein